MKIAFSATLLLQILCATLSPLHIRASTFINCLDNVQYWYESYSKSWDDHETAALELGGHLASITSDTIRNHIESVVPDTVSRVWLGGYRNPNDLNQWLWSDQSFFDYTNWNSNEPSSVTEKCIEMYGNNVAHKWNKWNDLPCYNLKSGVYMVPGGRCTSTPAEGLRGKMEENENFSEFYEGGSGRRLCSSHRKGCSFFKKCCGGLSCQPGVQKCYHRPRIVGEPCSLGFSCRSGFTCEAGKQVCRAPGVVGSSCHATRPCGNNLSCQPGVHKCYHNPRKVGEPCVAGYPCAASLTCEAGTQVCRAPGVVGSRCHATRPCGNNLSCQPGVHKCYHNPRKVGEPCVAGYPCAASLTCEAGTQVCRSPGVVGSSCHATRPCGNNLSCQPGVHICYHSPRPTSKPTSSPTSKPTSSPTSKPTSSPTSKPTSSPTSKPTSSPTSKPTSGPTTDFEYQNFTIGILQSSFVNDPIEGFTISLNYEPLGHSIKNLSLSLHYSNCTTPISDQVVALKDNPLLSGERTLLIDTGKFSSSDLVVNSDLDKNGSVGVLGFCVRAEGFDSVTGGTSVSFRQDEIHVSYDLSSNSFNVIDNTIIADEIETSENNITSTYEVEAFRCTDDFTRDGTVKVLAQNDIVYICVRPVDVPVHISDFEMYFWQDDENKYEAVSYGENVNPLSQLSTEDKTKRVASRIISRFFYGDANGFVVKGNAYLSFDTSRERQLRSIQEPGQTAEATYTMKVELEKEVFQKNAEESNINEVVGFVAVGTLVFSIIFLTFKKMKIQFRTHN